MRRILESNQLDVLITSLRSQDFQDFLKYCLKKDPERRPEASDLLQVSQIRSTSIRFLTYPTNSTTL
jgi:serine/threonine protein kinase